MNREKAQDLIICAYDLEIKSRDKYLGFMHCLRLLAITDRTLARAMKNEGLIHV